MRFLDEEGNPLLTLDDSSFPEFDSSQTELTRRTGVYVDPYKDMTLAPEHAAIWRSSLEELLPSLSNEPSRANVCRKLIAILGEAQQHNQWLQIVGD